MPFSVLVCDYVVEEGVALCYTRGRAASRIRRNRCSCHKTRVLLYETKLIALLFYLLTSLE